jgi:hypothetical protein
MRFTEEERMMCVWSLAQRFKPLCEEKETGGTLTLAEEVSEYVEEDPSE